MLLVRRSDTESMDALFAQMQAQYEARLGDSDWGPKYKIGPTFVCRGLTFAQIQTFAGSLVVQIVFDARKGKFARSVIFRFNSEERFKLLSPDGSQSEVEDSELRRCED